MPNDDPLRMKRRGFLGALGAAGIAPSAASAVPKPDAPIPGSDQLSPVTYPRVFTGKQLSQIAFPLGGIGTGYLSPAQPRPSVSLWPTLVPRDQVQMKVTMVETK